MIRFDARRTAVAVFVPAALLGCSGDPTRGANEGAIGSQRVHVELPARARGAVRIQDSRSGLAVRFALTAARDAPIEMRGSGAHYRDAVHGSDLVLQPTQDGVEDLVFLREPPPEPRISYTIEFEKVAGLRLVSRSLEFVDSGGVPRVRVAPPMITDARGAAIEAAFVLSGCAYDASPVPPWGRSPVAPGATRCGLAVSWDDSPPFAYPAVLDPAWTATSNSMAVGRKWFQAVRLTDGRVLVAGGTTPAGTTILTEIFDPASGTWAMTGPMNVRRTFFAAAPLSGSRALATGGASPSGTESSAEIFDNGSWTTVDAMSMPRQLHAAVTLGD
ncbi:MAG TPA: kelch repeat-containing protein, partial [Polyangiaceae bacterium]